MKCTTEVQTARAHGLANLVLQGAAAALTARDFPLTRHIAKPHVCVKQSNKDVMSRSVSFANERTRHRNIALVLLVIERGCYALFVSLPESARGPRHLVTRPGPLPLPPSLAPRRREAVALPPHPADKKLPHLKAPRHIHASSSTGVARSSWSQSRAGLRWAL